VTALNQGPQHYEQLLSLNLDRARALPSAYQRHILVDVAAARLWLYDGGKAVDSMKVIVGKAAEPTPMLAGMVRYAVVNPYWNMPPDLVRKRIAPKMLEGDSLNEMGFEALSDWTENARVLDQSEIDWQAVLDGRTEARVRQLPGGTNAMGRMKFMFPNEFGVYLHDTPEKALFKEQVRQFSSGCVRLEDAPRLGRWLFGHPLQSTSSAPEQIVPLPQAVPVFITYLTAGPSGGGIAFRDDPYGRDLQAERLASR
jgi:murein L,D-transpeptidase YcbB/YkuD